MNKIKLLLSLTALLFQLSFYSSLSAQQAPSDYFADLPQVEAPQFKADTFNIIHYGAKADGQALNTKSINAAIDACDKDGGGVVLIPGGLWLTGPITLKSNVNLHINRDALLLFTKDFDQYPLVKTNYEGLTAVRNQSPITAEGQENIAITGSGVIDGNGDAWRMVKKGKMTASQWKDLNASGGVLNEKKDVWYPTGKSFKGSQAKNPGVLKPGMTIADFDSIKDYLRPNLLSIFNCNKILLEGVTFQNSPAWCLHPLLCNNLTVRGIYAKNPWYAQNGDGIDLESCNHVLIENSTFDVGDDGICMKSGRDAEGRKRGVPTQNVIVRNDVVYHAHGGFVIGSEMSGGAKNLYVYNCSFIGTDVGLRFKTTRGRGGVVENIYVSNINMKDIGGDAIRFDMYYAAQDPVPLAGEQRQAPKVEKLPVTAGTPQFRNFYIKNIVCEGANRAIFLRGLPEMNIKNIWLSNLYLKADKGMLCTEADSIHLNDVHLITKNTDPVISLNNSKNISFNNIDYNKKAKLLFNLSGSDNERIKVTNSNVSSAQKSVQYQAGATSSMIDIN